MKLLHLAFFVVGLAFLFLTIANVGCNTIIDGALQLGLWFWPMAAVNILWYAADALGWAGVLGRDNHFPGRTLRLVQAQVAGESINNATPLLNLGGEPVKGLLLKGLLNRKTIVSSLVVDNTIRYIATILFIAFGLALSLATLDLTWHVQLALVCLVVALGALIGLAVAAQKGGIFGTALAICGRLGFFRKTIDRHLPAAQGIDDEIVTFYNSRRRDFAISLAWHLASRLIATVDALLLLYLLGYPVGVLHALFIQTVSVLLNLVFSFIPLQVGAAEGGHYILFQMLGMDPAVGVVFSLVRRVRGLLWIAGGLLIVLIMSRRRLADAA